MTGPVARSCLLDATKTLFALHLQRNERSSIRNVGTPGSLRLHCHSCCELWDWNRKENSKGMYRWKVIVLKGTGNENMSIWEALVLAGQVWDAYSWEARAFS